MRATMRSSLRPASETADIVHRRGPRFTRLRVAAFTATASAACTLIGSLVAGCSDESDPAGTVLDAAPPPPPGACVVTRTATRLCDAAPPPVLEQDGSADASADASSNAPADASFDAAPNDAGGWDGSGIATAPPESENRCLVTEDVTVACPSYVSAIEAVEGRAGAIDIVLAQVGLGRYASPMNAALVRDEQAHVQHLRIAEDGSANVVLDPVAPFDAADTPPAGAFALLAASDVRESQILFFAKEGDAALSVRSGPLGGSPVTLGAPVQVPVSISGRPRTFSSRSGEGFFVSQPRGGPPYLVANGPLVMVRGLPEAPRVVTTSITPETYVAATDPSGTPVLLFQDGETIRLREGDDLGAERWSTAVPRTAGAPILDVGWVGRAGANVPVVLYGDSSRLGVRFANATEGVALQTLGESYSTCPRSSYLGVTCDACPVTSYCEIGTDAISSARFVNRGDRLFVVFLATDTRRKMGYARSVVPIINVGCACTLEERSRAAFADSLVVVEVVPQDGQPSPTIVERMRAPLFRAGTTGHVAFNPRRDGGVDVVVGGSLARYDTAASSLPDKPIEFRVLRLSTGLIP